MEGSSMLTDQQDQYCENGYTTQTYSHENSNDMPHRDKKSILKFISKYKRPQVVKAKRAMLEMSQYLTSNYTTEPYQ
jgi:hypothetical protein